MAMMMKMFWHLWVLLFLSVGLMGQAVAAEKEAASSDGRALLLPGNLQWLNVERPLTTTDLKGKVVILDFWTYGCINCIHVAEELRHLEQRFGDRLAIIGVHTPKFDNEKNIETLRNIVVRLDRRHPILNDPDWTLMDHYRIRAWPTLAVFAPDGSWVGKVSGEGNETRLAWAIERLLGEYKGQIDDRPLPIALEKKRFADSLLAAPGKIAVSPDGTRVAVSDTLHHRIILAAADGRIQSFVGDGEPGLRDGPAGQAQFNAPQGVAFGADALLVADTGNHAIRRVDSGSGEVRTLAGTGRIGLGHEDSGQDALRMDLRSPWDLAIEADTAYIAMAGDHRIWALDLPAGRIRPYAGSGREGIATGDLEEASFSQPSGLALVGSDLYVADAEASAIRRVRLGPPGSVENVVGKGLFEFGDRDGSLKTALLQHDSGIAALPDGRLVVADTYNHRIKLIDLGAGKVTTILGTGKPGDRLAGRADTELNEPGGLAVMQGRILIADTNNHRIIAVDPDSGDPELWPLRK